MKGLTAYLAAALLLVTLAMGAGAQQGTAMNRHLTVNDTSREMLQHPALRGFAQRILPRPEDARRDIPLNQIAGLLPYHTHVDPQQAVAGLNRIIEDAASGKAVFHEIYTPAEQRADPAKAHTGLFFFRGASGAPFAVIAPGGGFSYVGSVHEGFPYAMEINKKGYNAFVLVYRVGHGGGPATQDMATAVSYIFRNAERLGVSTRDYSLWGSSAGARMAAAIGSHGTESFGAEKLPKPAAVVMAYTGHSDYSRQDPPTFVVVGENDGIAPPATMESRITALRSAGVKVEYRKYPAVGHGFGLGTGTSAAGWAQEALRFWESVITRGARGPS